MLKGKGQKTRKRLLLIPTGAGFMLTFIALYILHPYMSVSLLTNIFPFLSSTPPRAPAFYGENIDMSQILPASQHYITNRKGQDLIDIAATLGINLLRITNVQRSFNSSADSLYTKAQWDQVLDKMQRKGIKAIILIEDVSDNQDIYTPDIRPAYLQLVQAYIDSGVFFHPDVYAVDIKNEPLLTAANLTMLQAAHALIKARYPALKQTIGWWATPTLPADPYRPASYNWSDFAAGQKLGRMIDFYSIHLYGLDTDNFGAHLSPDLKTKVFISQVENGLNTRKPILIEEFGQANGDAVSDLDTIGSPQLQAYVYQGVYQALQDMHSSQLMGAVAFDFYSRSQYADPWAIAKNNGNALLPAAYILQAYALGRRNPSLSAVTVVHSQSYLVKNADNYATKMLHVSDRIGLKIQLDSSGIYSLCLSNDGLLQPVDVFHYDSVADSYYAVYQAINRGTEQLYITQEAACVAYNMDNAPIYALTINIQ